MQWLHLTTWNLNSRDISETGYYWDGGFDWYLFLSRLEVLWIDLVFIQWCSCLLVLNSWTFVWRFPPQKCWSFQGMHSGSEFFCHWERFCSVHDFLLRIYKLSTHATDIGSKETKQWTDIKASNICTSTSCSAKTEMLLWSPTFDQDCSIKNGGAGSEFCCVWKMTRFFCWKVTSIVCFWWKFLFLFWTPEKQHTGWEKIKQHLIVEMNWLFW